MAQTAVCNRHHSVGQQLCRWLLLSLDRLPSNKMTMTQQLSLTPAERERIYPHLELAPMPLGHLSIAPEYFLDSVPGQPVGRMERSANGLGAAVPVHTDA